MVLRIKTLLKEHWKDLLFALGITFILMIPYCFKDLLPIEHDTFFHVSRIEQLTRSIREGNFLPAIYPYENNGFGYASPLFYCDVFLIPSALIHLAGVPLSVCYKLTVAGASFFSALSMMALVMHISRKRSTAWIAACAYLFANYRITDIYVRGALGELFAFTFLPMVILGIYVIMEENGSWKTLMWGLTGLALSHNLTFLMGSVLVAVLFCLEYRKWSQVTFLKTCKAVGFAFMLSAFFTLPMIEQLRSQKFIVSYYGANSDLASGAMKLWQYFVNTTVFGYSGNNLEPERTMTVNIGWFLTFAPLLWFLIRKKYTKEKSFVTKLLILGWIAMILPSVMLPWDVLPLKVMQFPWRFNTLAMVLLCVPAALSVTALYTNKAVTAAVIAVMTSEAFIHVNPVFTRTFGMTSEMTWNDVTEGALCDPYYSAYYMRVELAGGDYLPLTSPDFRGRSTAIKYIDDTDTDISYYRYASTMTLTTDTLTESTELIMPLTWYKGYRVYRSTDTSLVEVISRSSSNGMLSFHAEPDTKYLIMYDSTPLRRMSIYLTWLALIILMLDAMHMNPGDYLNQLTNRKAARS